MLAHLVGLVAGLYTSFDAWKGSLQRLELRISALKARSTKSGGPLPIGVETTSRFDGPDDWWSSFWLGIGNATNNASTIIRVLPSTSFSFVLAIDLAGCPSGHVPDGWPSDCADSRGGLYSPTSRSSSAEKIGLFQLAPQIALQDNNIEANFYSDNASLPQTTLGTVSAGPQFVASLADVSYWVGIFPLSPHASNIDDVNHPTTSLLRSLKDSGKISSVSYGYTAGAKYKESPVHGSLTLGGYDSSRFDSNAKYIQGKFDPQDPDKDFEVTLTSITTNNSTLLNDKPMQVVIDSTMPYFYFPQSLCDEFNKTLSLEWYEKDSLYLINERQYYMLQKSDIVMYFTLSNSLDGNTEDAVTFTFNISAFLLEVKPIKLNTSLDNQYFYFPLQPTLDRSKKITLGRAFLQEAYLIADYEHGKYSVYPAYWPDDLRFTEKLQAIPPKDESNGENSGGLSKEALVGVIVGGIIGGLILACVFLQTYRRRQRNRRRLSSKSAPPSYVGAQTSEAYIAGGRSRASSLIVSIFPFCNTWSGNERRYEPPQDSGYVMPPEGEHKGPLGNELDANATGVYEMYQPKRIIPEVQGDTSYLANGSLAPGAVGGNAWAISFSTDPYTRVERDSAGKPANIFEMESTSLDPSSHDPSLMPAPLFPSPSSAEAAERHVLAENHQQERPEPGDRSNSERSTVSAPSPYPTNERLVSDRSLVSLSVFSDAGTGTFGSIFTDDHFLELGSEVPSTTSLERVNKTRQGSGGGDPGIDGNGDGAAQSGAAPEPEVGGKQPVQAQAQQPQTRRPSASALSCSMSLRSRSGSEESPVNLGAITEDREREGAAWTKPQ